MVHEDKAEVLFERDRRAGLVRRWPVAHAQDLLAHCSDFVFVAAPVDLVPYVLFCETYDRPPQHRVAVLVGIARQRKH